MKTISTPHLNPRQIQQLNQLWNEEFPENLENRFLPFLEGLQDPEHHLLYGDDELMGWAVSFERNGERWFSIAIPGKHQQKGYGRLLLEKLKSSCPSLNGWVIPHNRYSKGNGEIYFSPLSFYLNNGFSVLPGETLDSISAVKISCGEIEKPLHL